MRVFAVCCKYYTDVLKPVTHNILHGATVDMTTEGVEETTVVTAMVLALEEGLELAGNTTVCF